MSAKQRHKQRVVKRLKEKLELLTSMEENLHTVVREHVSKTEKRCVEVLKLEDTNMFLNQYGKIEQLLDAAFNMVELLTSSAEDMIEGTADDSAEEVTDKLETSKKSPQKNLKSSTRQLSDTDIERQLQEMIHKSGRKRHGSSEAASQTMPEEDFVFHDKKVIDTTQSINENQLQQDNNRNTVSTQKQNVKSEKPKCDIDLLESQKDFSETFIPEDFEHGFTEQNKNIAENNKKSRRKSSPKLEGKPKKEKVVPLSVRRHLNKESALDKDEINKEWVIDNDESSSSQVDSVSFNQDMILASSPKKKTSAQKKKKSPKKKSGKIDLSTSTNNVTAETDTSNESKHKVSKEKEQDRPSDNGAHNVKKDFGKRFQQKMGNNRVIKSEESEVSSEPTIKSSELSILEHELAEIVNRDSSNTSTNSDVKSSSTGKREILDKEESSVETSNLSKKSEADHPESSCATRSNVNNKETFQKSDTADAANGEINARETTSASVSKEDNPNNDLLTSGNLLTGKITPVVVSEIISPWCFFVQKNGPELSKLMEQICIYMSQGGLAKRPLLEPEVGTFCLAKYSKDGAFYRAYVMQIHKNIIDIHSEIDVLYVDYGNKERVKVTHLRTLPDEFKTLPMQAICCALAEAMPCSKYCVWAEDDIHLFRQYVTGQHLGCTPPTCRSSGVALPLLVELIVSLPMPIIPQGGIYLSQFSVAQLLISAKKARQVDVTEQLGLLAKSEEGAEEAAILSQNIVTRTMLAITELSESHSETLTKSDALDKNAEFNKPTDHEKQSLKIEQLNLKKDLDIGITSAGETSSHSQSNARKQGELISPRSENSETESQRDEGRKATGKTHDKNQSGVQGTNNKSHLDKIKEEAVDLESYETLSTTTSLTTDYDFLSEKGTYLSDLHFDLDDLYFNPQGQEVMLAHVRSLGEFYVHIISQQSGETLDRLMKSLNSLFENENRRRLTKLSKTFQPEEKKLCCAQFLQDNNFYRCIIRSTKPEKEIMKGRVLVHYIDFGDEEWLPKRRIFPLPAQFCNVPRLAIKCSLAYLKPLSDGDGEPVHTWSEKSLEKFVNIAGLEKTLHMHVVHGSMEDFKKSNPCEDSPVLGILLVDNTGTEEVCVNMDLIREGVAQLDTDQSKHEKGNKEEKSPDTSFEKWNPMEDDFFSKRNSYNIDIDDAGVATTGYKAKDEERICKFFSSGRDCWRGERCPYRHVIVESGVTYDQEPVYAIGDNQQDFLPQMGNWVAMEIATIISPSHFYAILPLGNKSLDTTESETEKKDSPFGVSGNEETLDDLLDSLNAEYSKRPAHAGDLLLRAIGEIVVARFSEDQGWYRARIIEVTEEKVKVFFVDFGNTEWLPEEEISDIKPEFLHLPFQAVECFMNVEPESDDNWTKDAKIAFRELIDGKTLVGYVKSRSWNGCLWVDLYDTSTPEDLNIREELVNQGYAMKAESQESHTDYSSNFSPTSGEALLVPG